MQVNVRRFSGPWDDGFALDYHLVGYEYKDQAGEPLSKPKKIRTEVGQALFRLKFERDIEQVDPLARAVANHIAPLLPRLAGIVPVPASNQRGWQPVNVLANRLSQLLGIPIYDIIRNRSSGVVEVKYLKSGAEKEAILQDRFCRDARFTFSGGVDLMLLDDLVSSGLTLKAAHRCLCGDQSIEKIFAVTLTCYPMNDPST